MFSQSYALGSAQAFATGLRVVIVSTSSLLVLPDAALCVDLVATA